MKQRAVLDQRLAELERVLLEESDRERETSDDVVHRVVSMLNTPSAAHSYLLLAVLHGVIPHPDDVLELARQWRVGGIETIFRRHLRRASADSLRGGRMVRVSKGVVVDLTDTSQSAFTTGIQRVARETVSRWSGEYPVVLVSWDKTTRVLETLHGDRLALAVGHGISSDVQVPGLIVPYHGTFVLPEIAVDGPRSSRMRSIAQFSSCRTVAIGFDCIPVSTAEVAGPGMPGAFSKYLSTLAQFDLVVPISEASGGEYRGWRTMLKGAGVRGPDVEPLELPSTGVPPASISVERTLSELGLGTESIVLAVGSHEPRKNHVNFLHASELLWREGQDFSVVMVGGNSWDTETFDRVLVQLRRAGRRVITLAKADDQVVWDLYRAARFSVFCSINEGFGLPIVESLASGTPVITSNFGSMRELGDGHGALLVDPHDVLSIAEAMRALFDDDVLHKLSAATASLPSSTWDDYSSNLWRLVTQQADEGVHSS